VSTAFAWDELDRLLGSKAEADVACPLCGPRCTTKANQKKLVLGLWRKDDGAVGFNCVRCPDKGIAFPAGEARQPRPGPRVIAAERQRRAEQRAANEQDKLQYAHSVFRSGQRVNGTAGEI
jgi:hypothetical protein